MSDFRIRDAGIVRFRNSSEPKIQPALHCMRLERILTHRLIQISRVVLPILVIALVAFPAWNYYARLVKKAEPSKVGPKLPGGVSVRTDGFTYSRTEAGQTKFTIHAKQSLGFKDEKYILKDVEATVYGATEHDPAREIRGQDCTYEPPTNNFSCTGNVEVQLDENTTVRTESMTYNHQDGIVTAPQHATLDRSGTKAYANAFEYGTNSGLLKLNGNVDIQTPDHLEIQTGSAVFQQKENWATMTGGVLMKSTTGWIRGLTARADLHPNTYKPKVITIEGNVTGESQSQERRETWKLRSGWLEATMAPDGTVDTVKTRNDAELEKVAADAHQTLNGNEIDTTLKNGKVDVIEARQNARMVMGADQTLESSQIWTNAVGSVQTKDRSVLKVGDSTIEGRDFTIENGEDVVTFNTPRHATMKKLDGQESSSDQTRASFDSRTNMLIELVQSGNFQFRTPDYYGHAQNGRFEEGGSVITLQGSPVVNDSEKRMEAAQIRVNQANNSFVATKNVVATLTKDPKDPVLVKADRAESGDGSMVYTGNVQLWRGDAYIKAGRLTASGQTGQNSKVHAEAPAGGKERVQSTLHNIRATSDTVDYDDSSGVIHYLGHVRAQKQDMILESPDMTVNSRDNAVTEIVASGGVIVTRVDQRGTGDRAVYEAATDVVTLTGKKAQVFDKERGSFQGPSLTMTNKGKTVHGESTHDERTITKHPVKNEKTSGK